MKEEEKSDNNTGSEASEEEEEEEEEQDDEDGESEAKTARFSFGFPSLGTSLGMLLHSLALMSLYL